MNDRPGLRWFQEQLARLTYKPNWTMAVAMVRTYDSPYRTADCVVNISMNVEDTYHPGQRVDVGASYTLFGSMFTHNDAANEKRFADFIADKIKLIEIHESREWFRRDGQLWDDPHK